MIASEVALIAQALSRSNNISKQKVQNIFRFLAENTDHEGIRYLKQTQFDLMGLRFMTDTVQSLRELNNLLFAINRGYKVTFNYCDSIGRDRRKSLVKNKTMGDIKQFTVSPYYVVWQNDESFLICHWPERDEWRWHILTHFRLTKITNVIIQEEKILPISRTKEFSHYSRIVKYTLPEKKLSAETNKDYAKIKKAVPEHDSKPLKTLHAKVFSVGDYLRENVEMHHNSRNPEKVTFYFHEDFTEEIMRTFGSNKKFLNTRRIAGGSFDNGDAVYAVTITVQVNEGFLRWLTKFCHKVVVVRPAYVCDELRWRLLVGLNALENRDMLYAKTTEQKETYQDTVNPRQMIFSIDCD